MQVINEIRSTEGLNGTNFDSTTQKYSVSRLEYMGVSVSFMLQVNEIPADVIDAVRNATLVALPATTNLTEDDVGVLAFQPSCK